jgi:hypothetical protein
VGHQEHFKPVRRDKIGSFSNMTIRYLGETLLLAWPNKDRKVNFLAAGPDVRSVAEDGELIRATRLETWFRTSDQIGRNDRK